MASSCIKTGCSVHFANYNQTISADLYLVGDCFIIRTHPNQIGGPTQGGDADILVVSSASSPEFWRDDIGIIAVHEDQVTVLDPAIQAQVAIRRRAVVSPGAGWPFLPSLSKEVPATLTPAPSFTITSDALPVAPSDIRVDIGNLLSGWQVGQEDDGEA